MAESSLNQREKLLPAFFKAKGIVRQHIESFDYFVSTGIKKIMEANSKISSESDENIWLIYKDIRVEHPSLEEDMCSVTDITPHHCRLRDMTYSSSIVVDVEYVRNSAVVHENNIAIGNLPIMLKSSKCVLNGKSAEELSSLQECSYDPGGYFVINGTERVILIQEQVFKNRILVELDKERHVCATVTSSTEASKSRTVVYLKNERVFLRTNKFTEDIPVVVVLKAMGVESDLEIVKLVGGDFIPVLSQSIEQCRSLAVDTAEQALQYIGARIKGAMAKSSRSKADEARFILISVVLSHLPTHNYDFYEKAVYLGLMVRRVFMVDSGAIQLDDKDYYGNKRLELAGQLISILFEDLFKRFNHEVRRHMDNTLQKKSWAQGFDVVKFLRMRKDIITKGFVHTISTGNWTLQRFNMDRHGVTAVLSRLSFISSLGHMTRISSSVEKNRKISGPRALQASQWGMICPSDTPEGEGCGLIKNLALLAHVTTNEDDTFLRKIVFDLGAEDIKAMPGAVYECAEAFLIFVNGRIVAFHEDFRTFVAEFRRLRREGRIHKFVSIYHHSSHQCVYIASDEGRICRPLVIVENAVPLVAESHMDKLERGELVFEDFVLRGLIEYLDVNEENDAFIAMDERQIAAETTHLEISQMAILGIVAGLIPYPHHNQSPRNTYQCAMGKQSMGAIGLNQHLRFDTLMYNLVYPQKPLVKTKTIEFIGFENLPAGQNAVVAVMSYSGYDIEDAIVINKASLDRGFARCVVFRKHTTSLKQYPNNSFDRLVKPAEHSPEVDKLDSGGFCKIGSKANSRGVLINKQAPKNTSSITRSYEYSREPLIYKEREPSIVDKVLVTSNKTENFIIKVLTRDTRRPEIGDKFSSRHGQKGVCGLIVPQSDLPFNSMGMSPDIIMNPHGFPSRMTVGKMIELIAGKAGVLDGTFKYGTAFGGDSVESVSAILIKHGFNYSGKDILTSGISGKTIKSYIFMGPVYYQKLKHMVADKMHARARGPKTTLVRQPREGRSKDGGLRLGEMERDCLIAYGTSILLQERLCFSSDQYSVSVCRECGLIAYKEWCNYCKKGKGMAHLKIPYACKLLFQELISMNIIPRIRFKED